MLNVALIRGDGIGPEITDAVIEVIEAAGVDIRWHDIPISNGVLTWEHVEQLQRFPAALKAPLEAPRMTGGVSIESPHGSRRHPSINNALRRELSLFVNVRPVRGFRAVSGAYSGVDLVIMREITEDMYCGDERMVGDDTAESIKRITRRATERLARFACEYACRHGRRKITAVHKANVLHLTDGLFLRTVRDTVAKFPGLAFEEQAIDAACYLMVKNPGIFDVLVMPNQYGDIFSDLAAGLVGSLGLAPGANIGPGMAVFEAAHGAAPDIAGRGIANPIGLILSAALMLDHLGEGAPAARIRRAVDKALGNPVALTPDLGGVAHSRTLAAAICAELEQ